MRPKHSFAIVLVGILLSSLAGQDRRKTVVTRVEEICVDSSCFQLEMAQSAAISELAEKYNFQKDGDGGNATYLFTDKVQKSQVVADLGFKGGKLKYISKYWDPPEDTAVSMMHVLYSLSSQYSDKTHGVCILQTNASDLPSLETKTVFLTCGLKYMRFDFIRYQGHESVTVQEILQSKDWGEQTK
jgi:hypothetical protein